MRDIAIVSFSQLPSVTEIEAADEAELLQPVTSDAMKQVGLTQQDIGMLLTGQHPLYCGAYENDIGAMQNIGSTFADVLTAAGYATAYVGKWHHWYLSGCTITGNSICPSPSLHG